MKNYISIIVILFVAVGCGKSFTKEEYEIAAIVGSYRAEDTVKFVFLENWKCESYVGGKLKDEATWKIVGKEVHVIQKGKRYPDILKIEPNGDLTFIAYIENGKRTELPQEVRSTFKKLKE